VFVDIESTMNCTTKAPKPATSKVGRESPHWFLQFSPRLIPWLLLGSIMFGP
jgi:hypothetical protein